MYAEGLFIGLLNPLETIKWEGGKRGIKNTLCLAGGVFSDKLKAIFCLLALPNGRLTFQRLWRGD